MSIASELARLQQAKADIKAAIEAKGVEVPSSALIDTYDDYIAQIEGGGGCSVASANSITFDDMGRISSVDYKEGVTEIPEYMFSNNTSLTSVTLPSTLTRIGNSAFNKCYGLTSIVIPEGVTAIGWYAFYNCNGLSSVTIPSTVTSIGADAFYYCMGLTAITVNAVVPPSGSAAFNNTNDCPIYVPCESVDAYKAATNWSVYASRIEAISGTCPFDGKYIAKNKYSDATIASATCSSAADSEISYLDVSLGYADDFNLEIGTCAESIGANAFRQLPNMKSLKISNSLITIGNFAFSGCTGLYSTTVDLKNVQSVGQQAFYGVSGITLVANSLVNIRDDAFRLCWIENAELSMPNINSLGARSFQSTKMSDSSFNRGNLILGANISSIGIEAFANANMNITLLATVPPTLGTDVFLNLTGYIYVPSANVSDYQNASGWSAYANKIKAIPSN